MMRTIFQAAEYCIVHEDTVRSWIERGELPAVNVSLNPASSKPRLRIRDADLQAFLAGRAVGGTPEPQRQSHRRKPGREYV